MSYTLQDYYNYSKFLPNFFKDYSACGETFEKHEIRDIHREPGISEYAVAAVRIWTGNPEVVYLYSMNSSGFRIEENNPIKLTECFDRWLEDVRLRKEEFEAFMQGVAMNYTPLSIPELDHLARS
jgi:hypothetical protein